jgi:hypothetical protein
MRPLLAFLIAGLGSIAAITANAEVLISVQEAALPPAPPAPPKPQIVARAVHPRPEAILKPLGDETSPMTFKVELKAYGGSKVDPDSVRVTYLKEPLVPLTSRLRKYITERTILMPDAEVAPGEHKLKIELKDTEGVDGTSTITLVVHH